MMCQEAVLDGRKKYSNTGRKQAEKPTDKWKTGVSTAVNTKKKRKNSTWQKPNKTETQQFRHSKLNQQVETRGRCDDEQNVGLCLKGEQKARWTETDLKEHNKKKIQDFVRTQYKTTEKKIIQKRGRRETKTWQNNKNKTISKRNTLNRKSSGSLKNCCPKAESK